jgi:succinate dehydrogenase / fumarate reductase flavoprotein subunit
MTTLWQGTAQRICKWRPTATGTPCCIRHGAALKHAAEMSTSHHLIMDEGAAAAAWWRSLDDGTIHRFRAHMTILATGGYGRTYFSCTSSAYLHGRNAGWAAAPRTAEFVQFHPTGSRRRPLITEGVRGEGGYLTNSKASASWSAMRLPGDLASRDVVSRAMTIEIREGRGVGRNRTTFSCTSITLTPGDPRAVTGISGARIFAGVDVTRERSHLYRRCITTWAASPPPSWRGRHQEERRS